MNKELIDRTWSILPKEFKEEVKRVANIFSRRTSGMLGGERTLADTFLNEFIDLFGLHNLTSDTEGEEMLYCDKSVVQSMAKSAIHSIQIHDYKGNTIASQNMATFNRGIKHALESLFGSKCLPDIEPKPAEPKPVEPHFDLGDKAILKGYVCTVTDRVYEQGKFVGYKIESPQLHGNATVPESDLEPYTEPEENQTPPNSTGLKPQEADKRFDTILKDGFRNERRLNIAAMAMQGYLSSNGSGDPKEIACYALAVADALIAECKKKGGSNE